MSNMNQYRGITAALHAMARISEPSISTRYSRVGAAIRVLEVSLDLSELNALDNEILAMHPKILEVSLTSPQVDDSDLFRRVFFVLLFRLLHGAVETANPIQG